MSLARVGAFRVWPMDGSGESGYDLHANHGMQPGSPVMTLLHVAQNEEFEGDRGFASLKSVAHGASWVFNALLYMAQKMAGTGSRRTEASN